MSLAMKLKMWGKTAANDFIEKRASSLEEAVVDVLKTAGKDLNKHEVSRVCEAANHACWVHAFSGTDKTAGFTTALGDVVYQKLKGSDKTASAPEQHHTSTYGMTAAQMFHRAPVRYHKMSKEAAEAEKAVKVASARTQSPYALLIDKYASNPSDIQDQMFFEVEQFVRKLASDQRAAKAQHESHAVAFCKEASAAHFTGVRLPEIIAALKQCPGQEEWKKVASIHMAGGALHRMGVLRELPPESLYDSVNILKTASPSHPLIQEYFGMLKAAEAFIAADESWLEVRPLFQTMRRDFMEKQAGFVGDAARGIVGGAGSILGHGAKAVGGVINHAGQLAIDHPLAALTSVGAGYFFGRPLAEMAIDQAIAVKDKMVGGVERPVSDFTSYPDELPLSEVQG